MSTLTRVLEPEVMDSATEAIDYNSMDHSSVNQAFVEDLINAGSIQSPILDLGTGTALIPIALCQAVPEVIVTAVDLAKSMLKVADENVSQAEFKSRVNLELIDAKGLPYADGHFDVVMSNSIVHHIPQPFAVLQEAVRVLKPGGLMFFRDLLRPNTDTDVNRLVEMYAGECNDHQQKMFDDSLRAALSLQEIRDLVTKLGFDPTEVTATTDRHWTWAARKK